jgi:hypothetical protein
MARSRFNDPIEPITLQNMRENGVRSLAVQCHQCRHEVIMNIDRFHISLQSTCEIGGFPSKQETSLSV